MRLAFLIAGLSFSLCAAPIAFSQSSQPDPLDPARPQSSQPALQFPGKDFSNTPPTWQNSNLPKTQVLRLPHLRPPAEPQIDPQMIVHPSRSRIGEQPQGSLVAQNIYPGLRLLPIGATASAKLIHPTAWPKFKIEPIPDAWPNSQLLPIDEGSGAAKPSSPK